MRWEEREFGNLNFSTSEQEASRMDVDEKWRGQQILGIVRKKGSAPQKKNEQELLLEDSSLREYDEYGETGD